MSVKQDIYARLRHLGNWGATDQELSSALNCPENSIRPARVKLMKEGAVIATSYKRGKDGSKKKSTVYYAVAPENIGKQNYETVA